MKRAFSTLACIGCSFKEMVEYACKAGIYAMEVRLDDEGKISGFDGEYMRGKGVVISNLGTSVALIGYNEEKIRRAKACLELAEAVGAKGIRLFLGSFDARFSQTSPYDYEGILKALQELCDRGAENGVEIWIETHNQFSTGKILRKLINDVQRENLKVIWDIIHPIEVGETPEQTLKYLGARIAHVHIKDGVKKEDPDLISYRYTRLGEGELPIGHILQLLKENGYQGYLSMEWEEAWRPELKGVFHGTDEILEYFNRFMDTVEQENKKLRYKLLEHKEQNHIM